MKKAPLICFYKDEKYFFCEDYDIHSFSKPEQVCTALSKLTANQKLNFGIMQIDFEFFHPKELQSLQPLIHPQFNLLTLKQFEVLTKTELIQRLHSYFSDKDIKKYTEILESLEWTSQTHESEFHQKVKSILTDISKGRFYQINLTSYFKASLTQTIDPLFVFYYFFEKFKGNYKAYIPLKEKSLICMSPELFVAKQNNVVITQPIKGSQPAQASHELLLNDLKEDAELSMIVDLLRNDLNGLSCEKYNDHARVTKHKEIMNLNYIQHTYSEVEIKTSFNLFQILNKILPGGSISGCPKIESLIKIKELEPEPRLSYTGNIGWIDFKSEDFILNISIRHFEMYQSYLKYSAGCGIVYDSLPQKEWTEYLNKSSIITQKNQVNSHLQSQQEHQNKNIFSDQSEPLESSKIYLIDSFMLIENSIPLLDYHLERTQISLSEMFNISVSNQYLKDKYFAYLKKQYLIKAEAPTADQVFKTFYDSTHIDFDALQNFLQKKTYQKITLYFNSQGEIIQSTAAEITSRTSFDSQIRPDHNTVKLNPIFLNSLIFLNHLKTTDRKFWDSFKHLIELPHKDILLCDVKTQVGYETSIYALFAIDKNGDFLISPFNQNTLNSVIKRFLCQFKEITFLGKKRRIIQQQIDLKNIETQNLRLIVGNSVRGLLQAELI